MFEYSIYLAICLMIPLIIKNEKLSFNQSGANTLLKITIGFNLFFIPFYILGLFELLLDVKVVNISYALMIQGLLCALFITFLINKNSFNPLSIPGLKVFHFVFRSLINSPTRLILLALISFTCLLLIFSYPRGFEVHSYHLPIGLHLFNNQTFTLWGDAFMLTYPANMSIYGGFLLQWLPERLVSMSNMLFGIILAKVLFEITNLICTSKKLSLLVVLGVCFIPLFSFSAIEIGADISSLCFLLLSVYFFITKPNLIIHWAILSGTAAGLAVGFKVLQIIPLFIIGILILIQKSESIEIKFKNAAIFLASFLFCVGFWFVRNYLQLNNPFYPIYIESIFSVFEWSKPHDLAILDRTFTQKEWVQNSFDWLSYPWQEDHYKDQNFKHSSGFGPFFATFIPPTIIYLMWYLFTHRNKTDPALSIVKQLSLLSFVVLSCWFILGDRQPRYLMGSIVLFSPIIGFILCEIKSKFLSKILTAILIFTVLVSGGIFYSKATIDILGRYLYTSKLERHEFFEYPERIDTLAKGSVILNCSARPFNYELFGKHLHNQVLGYRLCRDHFLNEKDESAKENFLRQSKVEYIYTTTQNISKINLPFLTLSEIGNITKNPYNGEPMKNQKNLYRLKIH
jgi:hypothetical protein